VLLARAAPYASHRENYSTLFDVTTMAPLVDGPPFVRALEELAADAKLGAAEQLDYDPAAVRAAFWHGRCGLALTWPSAAEKIPQPWDKRVRVLTVELPGAVEVYQVNDRAWEKRRPDEDSHVPLLGAGGRLGMVVKQSPSPEAAFHLLLWLSDPQWSRQASAASPATTLFRRSQVKSARAWVEEPMPSAAAGQYAAITEQTLNRAQCLFALRIPGRAEYLAALDDAVRQTVRGELSAQAALRKAADRWRQITARYGADSQRQAYFDSLGVE